MACIKKSRDKLGKVGKVNAKFVKFANFAMQIFTSSVVPDDIRILLYFAFLLHYATANMLPSVRDKLIIR